MMVCMRGRVCAKLGGTAGVYALVPATILLGDRSFFIASSCKTGWAREYSKEIILPRKKQKEEISDDKSTLQNSAFRAGDPPVLV